ncbi:MAG: hypothetical protein RBS68_15855 [Anaerolineales bacterium]|jgi:hypothetical protein|nr:hypothetical protein [Anaerolineales bacterium]
MTIDIAESKLIRNEWKLWLGWTLTTGLGLLIGFLPSGFLAQAFGLGLARVLSPLLAGILIGMGQWLILRNYLSDCSQWIPAAGAAWAIGYAVGIYIFQIFPPGLEYGLLGVILFGLVAGGLQWPLLRREIPQIVPWLLANVLGWSLGFLLSLWVTNSLSAALAGSAFLASLLSLTLTGFVAGAVVGLALVWIVRKPEIE